jgi:1-acyl-sn-glycerol-3-phosphate acyltransferase
MSPGLPRVLRDRRLRRAVTVPAVTTGAVTLAASTGLWAPTAAGFDLLRGRSRLPTVRSLSLALGWSTLESLGVAASAALWAGGRGDDRSAHYALQRWWADELVRTLRFTTGLSLEADGLDRVAPGPIVLCAQHASLVDALLPVWVLSRVGMRPRYVLKDSLQLDPCLDIVGNRLPNRFIDRDPSDSATETAALARLPAGLGRRDACVIFPEGRLATATARERSLRRIATQSPARLPLTRGLRVLAPVRPAGTAALLRAAPTADLVFLTHTGLESLQRLVDAPRRIPLDRPVRLRVERVPRREIPAGRAFARWLDGQWARLDEELVARAP